MADTGKGDGRRLISETSLNVKAQYERRNANSQSFLGAPIFLKRDGSFNLPNRPTIPYGSLRQDSLFGGILQGKQGPGVTHGKLVVQYQLLDLFGQFEQTDEVGDSGAFFAGALRHLILSQTKLMT